MCLAPASLILPRREAVSAHEPAAGIPESSAPSLPSQPPAPYRITFPGLHQQPLPGTAGQKKRKLRLLDRCRRETSEE
ncbi:hypothetical protein Anapl_10530 [Anas platyrhynchos]|uniref:Uncharacterized protein n=1 Tax=Anas platyrhynchos TaxID=8839 RepID=R0L7L5_ANAPL|nr:hypothetical protein Anapl_10530 [Anas platyrhynchos]